MKAFGLLALASVLLLGCGDKQAETDSLTNTTWQCVAFEQLGKKKEGFDAELRFIRGGQKGQFTLYGPKLGTYDFYYTRDEAHDPPHMDLIDTEDTLILAIYSLKDDTLKLCYSMTHVEKRPKDFSTSEEGGQYSFVFRRKD